MKKIYRNKKELIGDVIRPEDTVLDIGFWGQGVGFNDSNWAHRFLQAKARAVYGLDLEYDENRLQNPTHYRKASAENFDFPVKFDTVVALDLIEHLSNPGLFLDACARNLKPGGVLIIATPNCFNLFNMASKLTHHEPIMNRDETCYFNHRALRQLLQKNGWEVIEADYLYALDIMFHESLKKKFLNIIYRALSWFTPKFIETIVVVARPKPKL